MKLSEFFQNIALGELSSTPCVDIDNFEILPMYRPRVINALNQALEYFYSNFPLKISEVTVQLQEGMSRYYLDSAYAFSNPSDEPKFIVDSKENPFQDDVLHILEVSDSNGYVYPLNSDLVLVSVSTPEYNCIKVPDRVKEKYLVVKYQANHHKIPLQEPMNSNYKILIPSSYKSALQTYVACLILQNMGGVHLNESNALFAKFKTLTEELKEQGIGTITQTGINIKPQLRGWI